MFYKIRKGFFPIQDTGVIQGVSEAAQTISFRGMADSQQELTKVILRDPAVDNLSSFIGIDGTNTTLNSGRILINLKPLAERKVSASDVIRRLQPELAKVAGTTLFMQPVQDLTVEDRVSRTQFTYTLEDPNPAELNDFAPRLMEKLKQLPELRDVASDQQVLGLRTNLIYDRSTASRLGITPSMIDNTLYDAFAQRLVSTMFTQLHQYHVLLDLEPSFQEDPTDLRHLYIRSSPASSSSAPTGIVAGGSTAGGTRGSSTPATGSSTTSGATSSSPSTFGSINSASSLVFPTGSQVPLSVFTRVEETTVPIPVNHQGQFPVVTLSFNLAPTASLGDAVNPVTRAKDDLHMPPSIQAEFQGTAEAFRTSLANEPVLILAALVTVYIVLGWLYESYIHPITILSTLPSAGDVG